MGISNLNKSNKTVTWNVDSKDFEFVNLKDFCKPDEVHKFDGCFITKDRGYGKGAVLISEGKNVNIPQRYTEEVSEILNTEEYVEAIKAGKCGFKWNTFVSKKYNREGYEVTFVEI